MFDTPQQGYIAVSKYARYLDDKGRRETWTETVQRYFDFAREHVGANYPQALPVWEAREREMFDSTTSLETMPSMRLLMTAGEAVKRNNVAAYNCFAGPTRFMTKDGLRSFSETVGTTQEVLAGDGFWRKADVRSFGKQKTVKVTLRPGARSRTTLRQTIFVTPDHRWLTGNRGEVTDLRVGDLIPFNDAEAPEFSAQDFVAGFGFREDLDFKVISIEDAEEQEVFCVTEPVTGLFTLELGVLTGNCAYTAVSQVSDFSDILLILMHGTGVGFSCERQSIAHLPAVPAHLSQVSTTLAVEDSKEGWADAYFHLLSHLYRGAIPQVDYRQVRPRGSRLKVFGGRASGPEPLMRLFDFTVSTFREAAGRKLTSIEVHDVVCMIADIVVVGGVRRSALISLSNLSDRRMRDAKAGAWWEKTGHRALANNSAVYTERPDAETFLEEWLALVKSKSGERGIFNRQAAQKQAAKWGRRSADTEYGCNPCCVSGDTWVLTDSGEVHIRDLVGKEVNIWNGAEWSEVTPFSVGTHPLYRVRLCDGSTLDCTANHKFVMSGGHRKMTSELLEGEMLEHFTMPDGEAPLRRVVSVTPVAPGEAFCFDEPYNHTGTFNGVVTGQSEILLRPRQFCNLTEVVVRASDTLQDLARKVSICTDLGVFQSTLTHFPGISPEYAHNCEEERLLGVSLTGVMDHPVLNTVSDEAIEWLVHLRGVARDQAENTAKLFGVNVSAAITCNKPSGTVAQLTNAGTGGLHPRYSKHYVRTYRQDNKDPLTQFMKEVGVRHEPSFMKPDSETIFSFVVESPEGAVMRHDRTAVEQLEHWLMFQRHWCEHKPSITIYVKDDEWAEVGAWAFKHFDEVCGVSFLPFDNGTYRQAPFQEISAEEFAAWPQFDIDWTMLREGDDLTVSSQELACAGGACSI
jgi:intein/homing endonuclease